MEQVSIKGNSGQLGKSKREDEKKVGGKREGGGKRRDVAVQSAKVRPQASLAIMEVSGNFGGTCVQRKNLLEVVKGRGFQGRLVISDACRGIGEEIVWHLCNLLVPENFKLVPENPEKQEDPLIQSIGSLRNQKLMYQSWPNKVKKGQKRELGYYFCDKDRGDIRQVISDRDFILEKRKELIERYDNYACGILDIEWFCGELSKGARVGREFFLYFMGSIIVDLEVYASGQKIENLDEKLGELFKRIGEFLEDMETIDRAFFDQGLSIGKGFKFDKNPDKLYIDVKNIKSVIEAFSEYHSNWLKQALHKEDKKKLNILREFFKELSQRLVVK